MKRLGNVREGLGEFGGVWEGLGEFGMIGMIGIEGEMGGDCGIGIGL